MRYCLYLYFLLHIVFVSCSNEKVKTKSNNNNVYSFYSASDVYEFENETLKQQAYIHYFSFDKIAFLLRTTNKKNKTSCELTDTARLFGYPSDPDAYDDELQGGNLYPVYNFEKAEDTSYIYVAIEPSRGNRLFVKCSKDYDTGCNLHAPISSAGTLRIKVRYETVIQGPKLPEIPK